MGNVPDLKGAFIHSRLNPGTGHKKLFLPDFFSPSNQCIHIFRNYNSFMQTLVIGDIHGCFDELQSLLDKAGLVEEDAIISIGDHIDRGPQTPEVLNFFKNTPNAQLIMGNHERKHVRASRQEVKLARSQQISKLQFGDTYPEALAFMNSLPLYLDLPDAIVVHGYFEPGIPCDQQNPSVLCGTMGGERYLQTHYERPWYEIYDGNKPILVGHKNYSGTEQPFVYQDRVFGLDTNCVTGKALTGILLPSFQFVSVASHANHWMRVSRMFPQPPKQFQYRSVPAIWSENEEDILIVLIQKVCQLNEDILQELQSEPGYAEMLPRAQARIFSDRVGDGLLATLLQLARLGRLDGELAHKILKTPVALNSVIEELKR
jgi:serine/threonine protein phosphatase 1